MQPDADMYKTYIDYMTPPAGCNTTALSECMVTDGLSGGPINSMMMCSQNVTGCEVKAMNQNDLSDASTFWQGNATAYTAALETVGLEIHSEYEATVTAHQTDIAAIVTNYTTEFKALFKLWPGCNMTCVNDTTDLEDLLMDSPYYNCGCNKGMKFSESTTPFNQTTGDVEFAAEIELATSNTTTNDTTTTDSGSGSTWLIVGIVVAVVVLGGGIYWYKKKSGSEAMEGGEFSRF